jgi:hypothetical protein
MFGPHVRAFAPDGTPLDGGAVSFLAYGTHRWGVNVSCGDLDGDGREEIVTGAGPGAVFGPHVRGWSYDGESVSPLPGGSFLAYGAGRFGVVVACGELALGGGEEILTAPGPDPDFGCHVRGWAYNGSAVSALAAVDFFAFDPSVYGCGGRVAFGDFRAP